MVGRQKERYTCVLKQYILQTLDCEVERKRLLSKKYTAELVTTKQIRIFVYYLNKQPNNTLNSFSVSITGETPWDINNVNKLWKDHKRLNKHTHYTHTLV